MPKAQLLCTLVLNWDRVLGEVEKESKDAQLCLTLCDPMDCSPPGSSVRGIFQARVLEWVASSCSRGSSWPRDWTWVSCTVDRCFTIWTTREVQWSRKGYAYYFARQKEAEQVNALRSVRPNLGKVVRSFTVIVHRGCDVLWTFFWWVGSEESASSAFRSSWPEVYMLEGSLPSFLLTSPNWSGFWDRQNSSKTLLHVSVDGERGTCPEAALWLFLPGFTSPPFPDDRLLESAQWNSGKLGRLNEGCSL